MFLSTVPLRCCGEPASGSGDVLGFSKVPASNIAKYFFVHAFDTRGVLVDLLAGDTQKTSLRTAVCMIGSTRDFGVLAAKPMLFTI